MAEIASSLQQVKAFDVMDILQKAKDLEQRGHSIIHLEIGEPDFPCIEAAVHAARAFIDQGHVFYTPAAGLLELRREVSLHYCRKYGVTIPAERIFITPGASGALLVALRLILEVGDEMLLSDPGYPCHKNLVQLINAVPKLVSVKPDTGFQMSVGQVDEHWGEKTRGLVLTSPGNPTGAVVDKCLLQQLGCYVEQNGGQMVVDETYQGLVYDGEDYTALEICPETIVVNSFSKFFGMTGWRVGWMVVPERFVETTEKLAQNFYISAPSLSQQAAVAAIQPSSLKELERRRLVFKERRDYLFAALQGLGFGFTSKPQGGFYLYANSERFSKNSYDLAMTLLNECGVAVTPGRDFGDFDAEKFIRFAYTRQLDDLAEAVARLKRFLA